MLIFLCLIQYVTIVVVVVVIMVAHFQKSPTDNIRLEDDIKGAVVQNYLKEKESENAFCDKSTPVYSSSDTVNELLQGLVCDDGMAIKNLANETSEFLPNFSKALSSSESGCYSHMHYRY